MTPYGMELIIDINKCDVSKFDRKSLRIYFVQLCDLIKMKRCKLCWWDDVGVQTNERQTDAHTKGTSAIQFILTSNITIHTLDLLESAYVNVFSCKKFDPNVAIDFTLSFFRGKIKQSLVVDRL